MEHDPLAAQAPVLILRHSLQQSLSLANNPIMMPWSLLWKQWSSCPYKANVMSELQLHLKEMRQMN